MTTYADTWLDVNGYYSSVYAYGEQSDWYPLHLTEWEMSGALYPYRSTLVSKRLFQTARNLGWCNLNDVHAVEYSPGVVYAETAVWH